MGLELSSGRVEITPTLQQNPYLAGYGVADEPRTAASDQPYAPVFVRCLVLWDDDVPNTLISLDVLGVPRSMHQRLRPRLVDLAGWSSSDIVLQATHTHNGPVLVESLDPYIAYALIDLTEVESYSRWLEDRVVEATETALQAPRTPITLDYRVTDVGFARNRAGLPYTETAVPVLTARDSVGDPRAVVFSYGCHPVSAGWQDQYDGDFPAGACTVVEQTHPDCFALFLQGPAGDQDPRGLSSWDLRDDLADTLAGAVITAMDQPGRPVDGPIVTQYSEVDLPLDVTPTPGNLAQVRAAFIDRLQDPTGLPAWYLRHAEVMIDRIDTGDLTTSVPVPIQTWVFDSSPPLRLALTGGELVSGYAAYLRARHGGPTSLIVGGYANEVSCYLPSNEFLPPFMPPGSYEGGWHTDHPGIAGGSQTIYAHVGHFRTGTTGIEASLTTALDAHLG